jgi:hypothetical protein
VIGGFYVNDAGHNYYLAAVEPNAAAENITLWKVVGGTFTQLGSTVSEVDERRQLQLKMVGSTISGLRETKISVTDNTHNNISGQAGVC